MITYGVHEILQDIEDEGLHRSLEGLLGYTALYKHSLSIEGEFGSFQLDSHQDVIQPRGEIAQPDLQRINLAYEYNCAEIAVALTDAYSNGMRLEKRDVTLMLEALDELTRKSKPISAESVTYDRGSEERSSEKLTVAHGSRETDDRSTELARKIFLEQLRLADDGPTNPRTVALVGVLQSRWDV